MNAIYLDCNATTPLDPQVAAAMLPYIHDHFGNPSSGHSFGLTARAAVAQAREQTAALLGCPPAALIFTSGGTEANNHALKGAAAACRRRGNHIITSAVEHPAVTEVCRWLETQGCQVTYLPVDGAGLVSPRDVAQALTPQTILITIMHANNEVGSIQPIAEIAEIARQHGVLLHTDAAQSIGKIPVKVDDLGVDLLSLAGHKLYAPKGIGALYIRPGVQLEKLLHGANHEHNRRAGTENVLELVGLGAACELIARNLPAYARRMAETRDRLETGLRDCGGPPLRFNGPRQQRLPNTASVSFKGLAADALLSRLQRVAASAGAACHSDRVEVSPVLAAMGVPEEYAMGTIRFSTGRRTTPDEIDAALTELRAVIGGAAPA